MKSYLAEILFIVIFTISSILITWLLVHLSGSNPSKIFHWAKNTYFIIFPISSCVLIGESIITKKWFNFKGLPIGIFFMNLIFIIMLLIIWLIYNKQKDKENYYRRGHFTQIYMEQRLNMLFMIVLVVAPALNIYNLIFFIKIYCIN